MPTKMISEGLYSVDCVNILCAGDIGWHINKWIMYILHPVHWAVGQFRKCVTSRTWCQYCFQQRHQFSSITR